MFKLAIVATILLAVFVGGQPALGQAAISEPGLYAFYHSNADVLNAGLPAFSSTHASVSERDSGTYDYVPARRSSFRRHRH
jgi:hypothetical protein